MGGDSGLPGQRSRLAWWVVGSVLGIAMVFVLYSFLGTLVLGLFMYYATRPVYDRIVRRLGYRGLAAAVALSAVALPIVVLVATAVAVSASEVAAVAGESLAEYEGVFRPYLELSTTVSPEQILEFVRENRAEFTRLGGTELLGDVVNVVSAFGTALLQLFVALALAFYLLRDDERLVRWFVRDIGGERSTVYAYTAAVDRSLQTVYFGSILSAFVVALAAAVVFNLADAVAPPGQSIPLPTLLGLLAGIASLVPVLGTRLVSIPVAAYLVVRALGQGVVALWFPLVFVVVFVVVVDVVIDVLVRPYTSGGELHVGLLLLTYIFGSLLFGWYGLFLGPLLLVLLVQFNRVVLPELVRGESIPARVARKEGVADAQTEGRGDGGETAAGERTEPSETDGAAETDDVSETDDGEAPPSDGTVSESEDAESTANDRGEGGDERTESNDES
ncbi:AI-2E family transporter [Haladaptatus sp. NG-WS-4]